jgi:hypothetical protein
MIHGVLHDDLGLEKKSARWVPKLLNEKQKQQHVDVCSEFVEAAHHHSLNMLDSIVTMDEMTVCYHMPQMKNSPSSGSRRGSQA